MNTVDSISNLNSLNHYAFLTCNYLSNVDKFAARGAPKV